MDGKINEVRSANDIVDVISSYIPLEKKGKNFFGVCPFHDDSNPSMSVSKDKQKKFGLMIEDYIKNRENLKRVFLLIDYRHKPTEDDVLMYNYLKYYNLNITIVATKYDKVTKNNRIKQDKLIKDTLKLSDEEVFVPFSTVTKKGREDILKIIESY